jgi:hypothetical protein
MGFQECLCEYRAHTIRWPFRQAPDHALERPTQDQLTLPARRADTPSMLQKAWANMLSIGKGRLRNTFGLFVGSMILGFLTEITAVSWFVLGLWVGFWFLLVIGSIKPEGSRQDI